MPNAKPPQKSPLSILASVIGFAAAFAVAYYVSRGCVSSALRRSSSLPLNASPLAQANVTVLSPVR